MVFAIFDGVSASGKPTGFGPVMRRFESYHPIHFFSSGGQIFGVICVIKELENNDKHFSLV